MNYSIQFHPCEWQTCFRIRTHDVQLMWILTHLYFIFQLYYISLSIRIRDDHRVMTRISLFIACLLIYLYLSLNWTKKYKNRSRNWKPGPCSRSSGATQFPRQTETEYFFIFTINFEFFFFSFLLSHQKA